MTATIENFTDFHIKLDLGHHKVHFFVFNDEPLDFARAKIATLRPVLERIPPDHINGIAPILLLKERPLGGTGGGTMTSIENLHARNESVNRQRTELWGASFEVIEQVVLRFGRFGGLGLRARDAGRRRLLLRGAPASVRGLPGRKRCRRDLRSVP